MGFFQMGKFIEEEKERLRKTKNKKVLLNNWEINNNVFFWVTILLFDPKLNWADKASHPKFHYFLPETSFISIGCEGKKGTQRVYIEEKLINIFFLTFRRFKLHRVCTCLIPKTF